MPLFKILSALAGVAQWLSAGLQTKGLPVQFLVRAHAWVAGQVPCGGPARGNQLMFLSHIHVSLPLFLPPFTFLKINKIFKKKQTNRNRPIDTEHIDTVRLPNRREVRGLGEILKIK